jgi:hypothetical protein
MTPAQNFTSWRSRIGILAVTSITVLALAGCSSTEASGAPPSEISSIPNPEPTPMFASDDEALAAAELAYRNYIAVSDEIARDGGAGVERLRPFVSSELFRQQEQEYGDVLAKGLRAKGSSSFDSFRLESYDTRAEIIRVYVCIRVSNIRVVNEDGLDVTPADRSNDLPLQVVFVDDSVSETFLLISQSEVWTGTNFC